MIYKDVVKHGMSMDLGECVSPAYKRDCILANTEQKVLWDSFGFLGEILSCTFQRQKKKKEKEIP
jgi:hypothetical protein